MSKKEKQKQDVADKTINSEEVITDKTVNSPEEIKKEEEETPLSIEELLAIEKDKND